MEESKRGREGPRLSVVIPAYKEARRLEGTLERVVEYLSQRPDSFEIVVVDDGSGDGTAELAERFAESAGSRQWRLTLLQNESNRGKGYSARRGLLRAEGHYALLTDADLSTPIEELVKLEERVVTGPCRIAFGSRAVEGSSVEVHQPFWRECSGKLFNLVMRLIARLPYSDTQCGFKLFERDVLEPIFRRQRLEGFAFDVEVLFIARKLGFRMAEVPVRWSDVPGSTVGFASGLKAVLDVLRVRVNDWRGRYEEAGRG